MRGLALTLINDGNVDESQSNMSELQALHAIVQIKGMTPTSKWTAVESLSNVSVPDSSPYVFKACVYSIYKQQQNQKQPEI